jgi:hypothetical protein
MKYMSGPLWNETYEAKLEQQLDHKGAALLAEAALARLTTGTVTIGVLSMPLAFNFILMRHLISATNMTQIPTGAIDEKLLQRTKSFLEERSFLGLCLGPRDGRGQYIRDW